MGKDERDPYSNICNGKSFWDIVDKNGKAITKDTLVHYIICINEKSKNNLTNITVTNCFLGIEHLNLINSPKYP